MFGKKDKNKKDKDKEVKKVDQTPEEFKGVGAGKEESKTTPKALPREYGVLKGFYVSEKSSALNAFNQYTFKVFSNATKNEVRKHVEKSFDVKVKEVKTINLPRKRRRIGRYTGFKPGFKKAIVVLEEGHSIEGFQP
jgi:large subunit ribosomal protein L23